MEAANRLGRRKRTQTPLKTMESLGHDTMCIIFTFLDLLDLVRCSAVCKSCGQWKITGPPCARTLFLLINGKVMQAGVDQCRMRMGVILTGVGDKVIRLWSVSTYKCLEEYSLRDMPPLVDYDFDENKIVGLVGTQICIWRRGGNRSIFPIRKDKFPKGLCMRYLDPDAVVGCVDGTVRVFDMYSKECSQIIRMHSSPVTCLALGEDQLILSGSFDGSISVSGASFDRQVATLKSPDHTTGIQTLCYNPSSQSVFAGSTSGMVSCWDLRRMRTRWQQRVSPNVVYSIQYLHHDTSRLVVGGIDGVLRVLDQKTGDILSRYVMEESHGVLSASFESSYGAVERRRVKRLSEDTSIDSIPRRARPPISCLAVGWKKVVTTHNGNFIRVWKFNPLKTGKSER
ncbi:hypothetical protein Dimus_023312 [Dionaea muscipula]